MKFSTWLNGLTEDITPDKDNDLVVTYDANAATSKKVKITNIISSGGAATETDIADYLSTSTIVGFTGSVTGLIYYKKIGSLCFVNFYLTGTSNSASFTFTLPYTNKNITGNTVAVPIRVADNGSVQTGAGLLFLAANSDTVTLGKTLTSGGGWTTSGTKTAYGQFFFEVEP